MTIKIENFFQDPACKVFQTMENSEFRKYGTEGKPQRNLNRGALLIACAMDSVMRGRISEQASGRILNRVIRRQ